MRVKRERPRGVVHRATGGDHFQHQRYLPPGDLVEFVEHFWRVAWDLRGQPDFTQYVMAHPSIQVVFESGRAEVVGIVSRRFERVLSGEGEVFGIKIRPGAFYSLHQKSISQLTDQRVGLSSIVELPSERLSQIHQARDAKDKAIAASEMLRSLDMQVHQGAQEAGRIVELIRDDPELARVADVAKVAGTSIRSLQQRFARYVGVSPKWVIQRYRIHEALDLIEKGGVADWAGLAQRLGYHDQAHFIKEFKSLIGMTPGEYARAEKA